MNIEIIPVTAFQQNCSLIWDDQKNAAIIDPGGEANKLISRITELELNLKTILLTHGHLDHVGAAPKLKQHFNVPMIGPHSLDRYWFEQLPQQSQRFGLPEIAAFEPDRWLDQEGEVIEIGDIRFEVLHLPGHTPGHIGFIEHEKRISFTGDVLFKQGIGRTDFPGGDHQTLLQVIREKLYPLGDDMIIVAGHGPYTTIGQEKQTNPFVS
ncbi:MBL fold metallo-hydrolase [Pasteurella sp. PK-2025]|uniref:MBL fold metallo-hydrolase n=1 Tax=unclassified Pasteurella TaxID=2621516 RepID=UPI003C76EE51